MSECKDCRDSILNSQSTTISTPSCQDECSSDVSCEGISTYSSCVEVNVALSCIDSDSGANLSDVLTDLDTKICQTQTENCTVKIDANDTCCGYLANKITVDTGITKTINDLDGCKNIELSISCPVWNNAVLQSKWTNKSSDFQSLQYSTEVGCIVRVRGVIKNPSFNNTYIWVTTLPYAPLKKRVYGGFMYLDTISGTYKAGAITIDTDGKLYVSINGSGNYQTVPIELTFETN